MSCQVKLSATITDVPSVRRYLFPTDDNRGTDSWLHYCNVSLSPTGDVLALAREKRLVVLTGKWDSQTSRNQFQALHDTCFASYKENIKAVLCLPIVVQSQNSQIGADWTCIVVGFESGNVSFLTENCCLLVEEQLHAEPILSIKCQSQHSPRPDISADLKPEELYVIYSSTVCVISGTHLFNTLRNCRSQLARVQAFGQVPETNLLTTNPKKWGFVDQAHVNDVAVVGLDLSSTFDHLLNASTCGGFDAKYRAMPPHSSLVLAAGSKPFVGFHYALEGGAQPVLSDVAKAVASKLKSALPGWLTGRSAPEKPQTMATQPSESMACRFGLCDLRRTSNRLVLSPDKKVGAVSDALGRVTLIDAHKGIALRIFKGYREAQCAFIQVPDEQKNRRSTKHAVALFLVIYSPKKGTLDIFCAQQGTKIASFTASKSSALLYTSYGLMGFQNTSKSRFVCQYTCVLVDPDGQIKEIVIPYHFALTEKNSKRARDLHLLKRLKQLVKSSDFDQTEAFTTCTELKTTEIKLQYVELLTSCKEIEAETILQCVNYYAEKMGEMDGELDNEMKQLKQTSDVVGVLVHFYMFIGSVSAEELDEKNGNLEAKCADTKLVLSPKDMKNLQKLLDLSTLNDWGGKAGAKVSFRESREFAVADFLSVFDVGNSDRIRMKDSIGELKLLQAAEKVFQKYITRSNNYEELEVHVKQSRICSRDLIGLLLHYWVNRPLNTYVNLEREMENFSRTLFALTKTISSTELLVEYNTVSPFWSVIREILADSSKPFPALMAAILCRGVAQRIEYEKDLQQSGTSLDDENIEIWEKLSQESCKWTLLIGKLEDVSLLNIILANKPICVSALPKLRYDPVDISLKFILDKGKGSVSEIVAQWLTVGGVSPELIILNDLAKESEEERPPSQSTDSAVVEQSGVDQLAFYHLNIIKKQFPYSLEPSMLLANMCWEYALAWQKNIQDLSLLEASLKCLNQTPSLHIKTGLYNLVWNTHLKIIFESACKLINKVGKLPKERLCKQDTDLSDYQITIFMGVMEEFFDSFMETLHDSYKYEKPALQYEPLWENDGRPLTELALTQTDINYDLLHLHYQLATAVHMVTVFAVKHTKMINNLFDVSVVTYFFTDFLQKVPVNWRKSDSKVSTSRLQFLIKVISASMETVTVNDGKVYSADHVGWMSKCVSLARFWDLDVDLLKRYQVAQIFANGFDALGEELLGTVSEVNKLGPDLVSIAGKRLSQLLSSSQDLGEKIAAFSTPLTKYLDTLNGDWCAASDLESIMTLITYCLRCLDEDQSEYKTACLMLEACSTLQDLK